MRKSNRMGTLLVEILIATLFFALSASVVLQVFSATRRQSVFAEENNRIQSEIQNLAEQCKHDDPDMVLKEFGFLQNEGIYVYDGEIYQYTVVIDEIPKDAGVLRKISFEAKIDDQTVLRLPVARYVAEVEPG